MFLFRTEETGVRSTEEAPVEMSTMGCVSVSHNTHSSRPHAVDPHAGSEGQFCKLDSERSIRFSGSHCLVAQIGQRRRF